MKGYFVKGAWINGIHPDLIGKKIIRTEPCVCHGTCRDYLDYSHSLKGLYFNKDPKWEWVWLRGINNGCIEIEYDHHIHVRKTMEPWWNDGNWIEYMGA